MKGSICLTALVIIFALLVPAIMSTRNIADRHSAEPRMIRKSSTSHVAHNNNNNNNKVVEVEKLHWDIQKQRRQTMKKRMRAAGGPDTSSSSSSSSVQVAGSSLPDSSYACGSCLPRRLVMVSFVCTSLAEAETCPMAYKCMCKNKSYPVP